MSCSGPKRWSRAEHYPEPYLGALELEISRNCVIIRKQLLVAVANLDPANRYQIIRFGLLYKMINSWAESLNHFSLNDKMEQGMSFCNVADCECTSLDECLAEE